MFIAFHITVGLFMIKKEMHHYWRLWSAFDFKTAGGDVIELTVIWRGDLDCKGVLALLW